MPWLVGTALIHSLAATEKRGLFKSWTLLLAILAFSLSLLGTFLVRSGVLVSVHSFAADPTPRHVHPRVPHHRDRRRADRCMPGARRCSSRRRVSTARRARPSCSTTTSCWSRPARMVFVGTLAPLIADALRHAVDLGGHAVVHAAVPRASMLPLLALVADRHSRGWKRGRLGDPTQAHRGSASAIALVIGLLVVFARLWPRQVADAGRRGAAASGSSCRRCSIRSTGCGAGSSLSRAILGMTLAHIGLGVCVIAISTVESYTIERDVALAPGETVALGRYAYRFDSIEPIEGPNYDGVRAEVTVLRDGQPVAVLHPEKRNYWVQRSTHDRGGHRQPLEHGSVRGAGRGPRRGTLERPRADAAAHRLRVARGRADGAGRAARRQRSALSRRAAGHRDQSPRQAAGAQAT